jgi:hypothetical protein
MKRAFLSAMAMLFSASLAHGDLSYFRFDDPVGDHGGSIDVTRLEFTFDQATGDYTILLTADAANPFHEDFRVNINLFNPDTGTTAMDPSFFADSGNDLYSVAPVSTLTLTGTNTRLQSWEKGDRVATSSIPFGNPDGATWFRSNVIDIPWDPVYVEDNIAYGDSTVIVPIPGAVLLGALGLSAAGWRLRRGTT